MDETYLFCFTINILENNGFGNKTEVQNGSVSLTHRFPPKTIILLYLSNDNQFRWLFPKKGQRSHWISARDYDDPIKEILEKIKEIEV